MYYILCCHQWQHASFAEKFNIHTEDSWSRGNIATCLKVTIMWHVQPTLTTANVFMQIWCEHTQRKMRRSRWLHQYSALLLVRCTCRPKTHVVTRYSIQCALLLPSPTRDWPIKITICKPQSNCQTMCRTGQHWFIAKNDWPCSYDADCRRHQNQLSTSLGKPQYKVIACIIVLEPLLYNNTCNEFHIF